MPKSSYNKKRKNLFNNKFLFGILILIVFVFIAEISFSMGIKTFVKVRENRAYLSDFLKDTDTVTMQNATKIMVSYSPNPGEEKEIEGIYIKLKLKQLDIENYDKIKIPDNIVLFREYQTINSEIIKEKLEKCIDEKIKDKNYHYKINGLDENKNYKLPVGSLSIKIDDEKLDDIVAGRYRIYVDIYVDKERVEHITTDIEVGKKIYEYVMKSEAQKGQVFDMSFVKKEENIYLNESYVKNQISPEEFVGMVFARSKRAGDKINVRDFEKRKIFQKNDKVKAFIKNNGIVITTFGKALENGYEGENVKILNEDSNKIIVGRVKNDGTVEIIVK